MGIGPVLTGFTLEVALRVSVPDVERDAMERLLEKAHVVYLYADAARGNIRVDLSVV